MKNLIIQREGQLPICISDHMEQRLKERKGFNRQAIKRYVVQAMEFGETIQKNLERGSMKIVNSFKGDCVIFYIEKELIRFATVLTGKSIVDNVSYVKGVRKKKECRYIAMPMQLQ